jgi:hypothetical protein
LLKGPHEGGGKNFFRFDLVPGHVEREGESPVAMAFVHIPLFLFTRLPGSLGKHSFGRVFAFKLEQDHPDAGRDAWNSKPVLRAIAQVGV